MSFTSLSPSHYSRRQAEESIRALADGEEEEEMMASSKDPIIQKIWNEKILASYAPVPDIFGVYKGEKIFIDWKSGLEPAVYIRYSTPSGDPLIHIAPKWIFLPNFPGR